MKCNMDCEHCTRPVSKCKGGSEKTAYIDPSTKPLRRTQPKDEGIKRAYNYGRHVLAKKFL